MAHPLNPEFLDHGPAQLSGEGSRLAALGHILGGYLAEAKATKEGAKRSKQKNEKENENLGLGRTQTWSTLTLHNQ